MEVKEAVKTAKMYLSELFESEGIINVGREEVVFDEFANSWKITLGFSRPWDKGAFAAAINIANQTRSFKIILINDEGRVVSLTDRLLSDSKR